MVSPKVSTLHWFNCGAFSRATPSVVIFVVTGRKRRGAAPAIYVKASSSIARHVLQQLESVKSVGAQRNLQKVKEVKKQGTS